MANSTMQIGHIIPHIEALIFASDRPLSVPELTELANSALAFMDDKITLEQVESAIEGIVEKYNTAFYPFEMRESGGGWQFLTKKEYHKTVAQLNGEKFLKRLSSASLETLAIIAYKQPITKGEVEAIRGVNSDYSIQKLLEKELIIITGRNESLPGKPLVYATSKAFMDYFGLNSPDDLPRIKEVLAMQEVIPTNMQTDTGNDEAYGYKSPEEEGVLVVRGNGELIEEPATVVVKEDAESVAPEKVIGSEPDLDEIVEERIEEERTAQEPGTSTEEKKEEDPGEPGNDTGPLT
jgi:segregation and condensation protein B